MHADTLFTIAEVAAAFAGFASLVAAISNRSNRTKEEESLHFNTLKNVLVISLLALGFALAPIVMASQGVSESASWRISAALCALVFGAYLSNSVFGEIIPSYQTAGRKLPATLVLNTVLAYAVVALMASCAADLIAPHRYLIGLAALLYFSGAGFVRFFVSVGSRTAPNKSVESDT